MRGGIRALVNRAASLLKAAATPGVAAPRCAPASPPPVEASQQAVHRAFGGFSRSHGSVRDGTLTCADLPCPHGTSARRCNTAMPAAWFGQHDMRSAFTATALHRGRALSSEAWPSAALQTALLAGLHSSAAARDDDDRSQRGNLQSEVHAAKQQLQQTGATPASGASAGGSNDGATSIALGRRPRSP